MSDIKFCVNVQGTLVSAKFNTLGQALRHAHKIGSKMIFFITGDVANFLRLTQAGVWELDCSGGEEGKDYYGVPLPKTEEGDEEGRMCPIDCDHTYNPECVLSCYDENEQRTCS